MQKKKYCVLGDVYGVVMVPKELDLEKDQPLDLRFHVPDRAQPIKVSLCLSVSLSLNCFLFELCCLILLIFCFILADIAIFPDCFKFGLVAGQS